MRLSVIACNGLAAGHCKTMPESPPVGVVAYGFSIHWRPMGSGAGRLRDPILCARCNVISYKLRTLKISETFPLSAEPSVKLSKRHMLHMKKLIWSTSRLIFKQALQRIRVFFKLYWCKLVTCGFIAQHIII